MRLLRYQRLIHVLIFPGESIFLYDIDLNYYYRALYHSNIKKWKH